MDPYSARCVAGAYDVVAEDYAVTFGDDLVALPVDRAVLDAAADLVASEGLVLDLGCGPGQVGDHLAGRGLQPVGLDLAGRMLGVARARGALDRVVQGDMRALPFTSGCVAGVVAAYSVQHVPRSQLGDVLGEVARVLRPGGVLVAAVHLGEGEVEVTDLLGHSFPPVGGTFYGEDEVLAALARAGLSVIDVRHRAPEAHEHPSRRLYVTARRPDPSKLPP